MSADRLSRNLKISFRDQLRSARAAARSDAESFIGLIHVFERLGSCLHPNPEKAHGLGKYKGQLRSLCKEEDQEEFERLFFLVRNGRNDAIHQGHVARNLAVHACQLVLLLEDGLSEEMDQVQHFMIANPMQAYGWQLVSQVRHMMLENAFSCLPIQKVDGGQWHLLSDDALVAYLRGGDVDAAERKRRLNRTVEQAFPALGALIVEASVFPPDAPVAELVAAAPEHVGRPALIVKDGRLLGIVTAEDLL